MALLLSCARAGLEHPKPGGPVFEVEGVFRIGKPGDGWKLHRNRRMGKKLLLDYKREDADVDLRVTLHPLDDTSRRLPLPTLAEGLVLHYGRGRGLVTVVHAVQRADFGDHEGFIVHATRSWKPNVERRMVQVFLRTADELVMVTYIAPPDLYERFAPDFAHALDGFVLLLPAEGPVFGLHTPDDLPQKAPAATGTPGPLPVTTPPPPSNN
jgi:hypothetical protein